jgi:hypothetical protein
MVILEFFLYYCYCCTSIGVAFSVWFIGKIYTRKRQPLNEKGFCTKKNILEVFSGVQYVVGIFKLKFELGFIWNM